MKFSCGLTDQGLLDKLRGKAREAREWKRVFLWWPTTVKEENGKRICVWLRRMDRRYPNAIVATKYGYHPVSLYNVDDAVVYLDYAEYKEIKDESRHNMAM